MTRAEWIQQALLACIGRSGVVSVNLGGIIEAADVLEKSGVAPWGREPDEPVSTSPGAAFAVLYEREACAKLADEACAKLADAVAKSERVDIRADVAAAIAFAIRARGAK